MWQKIQKPPVHKAKSAVNLPAMYNVKGVKNKLLISNHFPTSTHITSMHKINLAALENV